MKWSLKENDEEIEKIYRRKMRSGRSEVVTRQVVCVSKEVVKCIQCSLNFFS